MAKHKGIIAYGTEEDRQRLAVLSHLSGKSGSEIIIDMIRHQYKEVVGAIDPKRIMAMHTEGTI